MGWGGSIYYYLFKVTVSIRTCVPNFSAVRQPCRKKVSFKFISRLGVRSLANARRARQFNPLNPPGVGWVPLPQTNMAAVVGRAWSCVVVRGRAQSVVRSRSCVVVRGRAVLPASWPAARFAASTAVTRTNELTNNI